MFRGSIVALVTPFREGAVDAAALERLVEMHIAAGTHGLVPCGTTGESATLSHAEHQKVVELVVERTNGRVPVIAGTGSNSTQEAVRLTKHAQDSGADGALLIAPYYNRPSQEGLYRHFMAIADSVSLPLILYNIPSRTGVSIEPATFARLAQHENVVAVKEASGRLDLAAEILGGTDLEVLAGDDALTLPVMALGGVGVISVAANVVPRSMADLVDLFREGRIAEARKIFYRLFPLFRALFVEVNPVPVKRALALGGVVSDEVRLPLYKLQPKSEETLRQAIAEVGLELDLFPGGEDAPPAGAE
ncbi:MAG TPA: 4-hydroxy-tetrahydrodipicolinate synthase [Planctomycetota bacterium]|jgi:4-hydroxy-tetrahydrodipicolinate synthase|nr:4-hydroxy-tetrahydrodipicolinate synthase [Planctomycetota bacterium]OQC22022.1 MAG: 4-hydroxy-tetrahydrodipicolinate synthase [Planctomycetes bacterium ADurb.Bin069]HNR98095.1 4-hydroxy-tetrahydrodipicolinate synthase [Planctomycetota bacterium]HNU25542.1 4-hydroxy-tetrahydrodipicolinate synthase [Planctomycetota bacterium]HOE28602.1 4-hydroxy-tetrahydrodipicolinate synthase [Planctomycetota bacterium]